MIKEDVPNFRGICDRSCIDCCHCLEVSEENFVTFLCEKYDFIIHGSCSKYVCDSWQEQ